MVTKVKVKGAPRQYSEEINDLVEEKTNTKIFGIWRVRTRNWYATQKWRKKRGKEENTIWEAPSYYSNEGTQLTASRMQAFLKNSGYFNVTVSTKTKFKGLRKRKAEVTYTIKKNRVYKIRSLNRNVEDYDLYVLIEKDAKNSLLKKRNVFKSEDLVAERERLMMLLRKNGYYDFSREYIYFDLDSSLGSYKIDIQMGLKNPGLYTRHKVYRLNQVVFQEANTAHGDTNIISLGPNILRKGNGNPYLDDLLFRSLTFSTGDIYNENVIQESLKNLRKLQHYQYVDVQFSKDSVEGDTALLNLKIELTTLTRYQTQFQSEAITSEQNGAGRSFNGRMYGLAASLTFRDLNFLKRGIQTDVRLRTSTELSLINFPQVLRNNELSLSNNYYFAKPFLSRIIPENIKKDIEQSTLSLNGFLESNPDFSRQTANISAGYLIERGRFKHYILPIDFNLISTSITSDSFQTFLDTSANFFLRNLFDNHTIAGSRWGLYYSNKVIGSRKNYIEFTANMLELGGNLFYLGSTLVGQPVLGERAETYDNTFLGMHYFQYAKGDYDFRFHQKTFWNNEIVYRAYFGMIYPFGNTSNSVPFEKRYFAGGSNSIRGWAVRRLGPGSYNPEDDDVNFVYLHSGDIKLEANIEYRFSVSPTLKMALFADAGNIWNHPSNNFQVPGGDWQWDRFYKEFAVAGGLGLRFDFTYFVFRTDLGFPFRDPSVTGSAADKWFPSEIYVDGNFSQMVRLNFGIGYPF
ncbi:MAG: BamA/TamA family outer membrane protein [Bacteroidia bacterium]